MNLDQNKPMLPISIVADTLGVHQRTLRIYDDEGILKPSRSPKNRRLYSFADVEKGKLIQHMTQEMGLNLAGIKLFFRINETYNLELDSVDVLKGVPHYDY